MLLRIMQEWYYVKGGQQLGPVNLEQLRGLARSGEITAADLVWNSDMKDWTPAGQVDVIFSSPPDDAITAGPAAIASAEAANGSTLTEIVHGSEPIDIGACVKRGFELTKRHFSQLLLIGLAYFGVAIAGNMASGMVSSAIGEQTLSVFIFNFLIPNLISTFLNLGMIRIGLNLVSGKEFSVGMMFGGGRYMVRAIIATILFSLMVIAGLILFIVPGIYLSMRYGAYLKAIVDRDMGVMESFSYSSSITTNNRLNLFLLSMLGLLIVLAGLIALVVGVIFAYPVVLISWVVAYRWMQYGHRVVEDGHTI